MNTYLSIITLNVNGLNSPIKRHRVKEWIKNKKNKETKKTRPICILPIRDSFQTERHLQIETEGFEKNLSCQWMTKETWGSNTYIRQIDFKTYSKRQRRTLCNNKGDNTTRGYKNCKYFAPNMETPKYRKQLMKYIMEINYKNIIIVRDFNTPLISMERSSKQKINKETGF